MAFEYKGQQNFNSQQAYLLIGGYNKMLREKGISSENEEQKLKQEQQPQTENKQSGFGKY